MLIAEMKQPELGQFATVLNPALSVIIPTACTKSRVAELRRAIDSVLNQADVKIELLIVINGAQWDKDFTATLQDESALKVCFTALANVSHARLIGLMASSGKFFCFLDDDDEFLPGGLAARANAMVDVPAADVLVTDGLICTDVAVKAFRNGMGDAIRQNPARAYLTRNWFYSPSATFRRSTVGPDFFDMPYKYFEWTYLLFRLLCAGKSFHCIDVVTYRKFEGLAGSVSSSREYQLAQPAFLRDVMNLPLPPEVRQAMSARRLIALNANAHLYLEAGEIRRATGSYLQCVTLGGWRYLLFGRRIVYAFLERLCS